MNRWPVEAAGALDAKNAPTAPWKTAKSAIFHSCPGSYWYPKKRASHFLETSPKWHFPSYLEGQ